jgi:uncharacterized membrane protein (UPF0136 family)
VSIDAGTVATLTDVVVRNTESNGGGMLGNGIDVQHGARLEATRLLVEGNRNIGLYVANPGTEAVVADAIVRGTRSREVDGEGGRGVSVEEGARLEASRMMVDRNRESGLLAAIMDTQVFLTDVVIRDTEGIEADSSGGIGMLVPNRSRLEATRLLIERNREVGILAANAELLLTDVVVRETRPTAAAARIGGGRGIEVQAGARVEIQRMLIDANREVGANFVETGTEAVLADVVIRDTDAREGALDFGYGVDVQLGARLTGERLLIERATEIGLLAGNEATVALTDVTIGDVERSACDCPERGLGHAVAAVSGSVSIQGFEIRDAATCGVFLSRGIGLSTLPSVDATRGVVTRSEIGACVQVEDYDLTRLMREVSYLDNGANLETTRLPVPPGLDALP